MASILVVDDQPQPHLIAALEEEHELEKALDGREALELVEANEFDLVLSDIFMPNMGGIELLTEVKKIRPDLPLIFMTSKPSIETAQQAIREGAFDYITKEHLLAEATAAIHRALERIELKREVKFLHEALHEKFSFDKIIGKSQQMQKVFETIKKVLFNDTTVLILGETGAGKEMAAKAIHFNGKRAKKPYVAVNCAAISPHLLESELFGHERGAFTGAITSKKGLFEEADGGTIFLDEVSEMPKDLQSKLLRVLQEREVQRVGATRPRKIDVRVIAASNRDLGKEVDENRFRADLYYRLNVVPIPLPPLRDRSGDITYLANHFMALHCARNGVPLKKLDETAITFLEQYGWPGNVRELENEIERAVSLREESTLTDDAFKHLRSERRPSLPGTTGQPQVASGEGQVGIGSNKTLAEVEKDHILGVLSASGGNKSKAAKVLDIDYSTLLRKLKRMGIDDA